MRGTSALVSGCLALVILLISEAVTAQQGVISIYHVSNLVGPAQVRAGENVRFLLRFNNNTGRKVDISNGFRLHSLDGATWDSTTIDTAGVIISGESRFGLFFDIAFFLNETSCDGQGSDTVGVLGAGNPTRTNKQLAIGYDDTSLAITAWFSNTSAAGKTICLDTSFYPPGGTWKWVCIEGGTEYVFYPTFQGLGGQMYNPGAGYCFQIQPDQPAGQGEVAIAQISNRAGGYSVEVGEPVRFLLKYTNNTGQIIGGFTNGFILSSPDGAVWDSATIDTVGYASTGHAPFAWFFDLATVLQVRGIDGQSFDTILAGGAAHLRGLPISYSDSALAITAWFHDTSSLGKHVCLDSSFVPPAAPWLWVGAGGSPDFHPTFVGLPGQPYTPGLGYCVELAGPSYDSMITAIQWRSADGGNDHWYGILPEVISYENAKAKAPTLYHEGITGHLATITTAAENDWVFNNLLVGTNQPSYVDQFYLGGEYVGGFWVWSTGEPFAYTNWSTNEPNNIGIETALAMFGTNNSDPRRIPGKWNNVLYTDSAGDIHRAWSVIEWEVPQPPQDSLIKLTQWRAADGGNDHWYAIFAKVISYEEAKSEAPTFFHDGEPGYLATITSAEENSFIFDHLATGTNQPSYLDQFYLGGEYVSGLWNWMTGEPFIYTNWAPGEPNNIGYETAMAMFGPTNDTILDPRRVPGKWNNVRYTDADGDIHRAWSIIEWGPGQPPGACRRLTVPGEYPTIQDAVAAAYDCDTIVVQPGSYVVPQIVIEKRIVVRSVGGPLQTTIMTSPPTDMFIFRGAGANGAVLEGFTLDGGHIAIWCQNAAPIIRRNLLKNQTITNWAALVLSGLTYGSAGPSPAIIENNTIVHSTNGGISTFSTVPPIFRNNIVAFNDHYGIHNQPHSQPIMGYNNLFGNPGYNIVNVDDLGPGALTVDPMFAADFSLNSGSPCINAGDPNPIYNDPDGSRNDMGAIPSGGGVEPPDVIPTNEWILIYCAVPLLDRGFLPPGSIITAYDPAGVLCGATKTREDGSYGLMPVYRDDPYTQVDEGCQPGDLIGFKVNGVPVYAQTPVHWTRNGDRFEVCQFLTQKCQDIHLHTGWNLISWNVALTTDIETIIAPFRDRVDLVLGFDRGALAYDPDLVPFSTLHEVDYFHGYWIKMNGDATLHACGGHINQFNNWIPIYQGWNLVGYWPDATWTVPSALFTVMSNLQVAIGYEMGIKVFIPGQDMYNTLTQMKPGLGYWIRSSAPDGLEYFFMPTAGAGEHPIPVAAGGNEMASRDWMSLYGKDITLDGQPLGDNAWIEVFTADGVKVGQSAYNGSLLKFMPVYGYDVNDANAARYPKDGDLVNVFVNGVKTEPSVEWHGSGTTFQIASLTTSVQVPGHYALVQNFPNPFNPLTTVSFDLPKACHVTLTVYNMLGQRIRTLTDRDFDAGQHSVEWDSRGDNGDAVASGVYLYRIEADSFVATRKMMLLK